LCLDILIVTASFWLAALVLFDMSIDAATTYIGPLVPRALIFGVCILFGLLIVGLYRARQRPSQYESLARVLLAVFIGGMGCILIFYLVPDLTAGRGVLAISMVFAFIALSIGRLCVLPIIDRNPIKKRVVVLGVGSAAQKIGRLRRRSDRRQFEIIGYIVSNQSDKELAEHHHLHPVISSAAFNEDLPIDEVVVALDERRGTLPTDVLLKIKAQGIPITDIISFLERETGKMDLDLLTPAWLVYANVGFTELVFTWSKRIFDIVVSTIIFVLTSPIFLFVTVSMWLTEGPSAPILYRQTRTGRRGVPFELLKFRSMRVNAEAKSGAIWSQKNDNRVTPVGKMIRRFRIDELPQLLNIIRGEMSIVGPRPERPEFVELLQNEIPLFQHRHAMRPGLTGWAQLNYPYGASVSDARVKLSYDLYYVKNARLLLDILIFLQTIEVVIWGKAISMAGALKAAETRPAMEDRRQPLSDVSDSEA
jgi:sugar transferase (PEP-CTERM system associated)